MGNIWPLCISHLQTPRKVISVFHQKPERLIFGNPGRFGRGSFRPGRFGLGCQGFFSRVSGAVIRPLSQWQMPTFFPNLNKKIPNEKVIFM